MNTPNNYPNILVLQHWLEALTSGLYPQCHGDLITTTLPNGQGDVTGFCAIGLFFHLNHYLKEGCLDIDRATDAGIPYNEIDYHRIMFFLLDMPHMIADSIITKLLNHNDTRRHSFPIIAQVIRGHKPFFPLLQDLSLTCSHL